MSDQVFFIAVPASDQAVKIVYGVGVSPEAAINDAFARGSPNRRPAVVDHGAESDEAAVGQRYSYTTVTGEVVEGGFSDEADAQAAVDAAGFSAIPCTKALFVDRR